MSLETLLTEYTQALKDNTEAVNRQTAVTESLMNLRAEAIEQVKGAASPASKPATKKADPKPEISTNPEDRKPPEEKSSGADYEGAKALVEQYQGLDENADARKARTAKLRKILGHEKIKAKKVDDIPEGMVEVFKKNVQKLINEYEPPASDDGDEDDLT